jgi:hypothetical protein
MIKIVTCGEPSDRLHQIADCLGYLQSESGLGYQHPAKDDGRSCILRSLEKALRDLADSPALKSCTSSSGLGGRG